MVEYDWEDYPFKDLVPSGGRAPSAYSPDITGAGVGGLIGGAPGALLGSFRNVPQWAGPPSGAENIGGKGGFDWRKDASGNYIDPGSGNVITDPEKLRQIML